MPSESQSEQRRPVNAETILELAWETVWEACIRAFLVLLLGSIALDIVGGILHDMTPSTPPIFHKQTLEAEQSTPSPHHPHFSMTVSWSNHHQFLLLSIVFFAVGMWNRLRRATPDARPTRAAKILHRLSEDWFSMIVVNAFGAMIAAWLWAWTQRFSWTPIIWDWLVNNVFGGFHVGESLFKTGPLHQLSQLWHWYNENQFRFMFWFFYVAAICDDLGLPNFKSLGRWLGRKLRKRTQQPQPETNLAAGPPH